MTTAIHPIEAEGLVKIYGETRALDGFDVTVESGTVLGLLGPNGAGKTTAVRILATLLRADGGTARVAGYDITTQAADVRYRIGFTGQSHAIDDLLTGTQNLVMFGRLNHLTTTQAKRRSAELLDAFGLTDAADKQAKHYSGGMKRRLDLAAGMILSPKVLFLDEPTTGLDPRNRNEVWNAVRAMVAGGTTVLLTTQYMDEADQLADRIVVMNHGKSIAEGTPDQLKSRIGGDQIDVVVDLDSDLDHAIAVVAAATGSRPEVDRPVRRIVASVDNRVSGLSATVRRLEDEGIGVEDLTVRRPTLDEVFLRLTGQRTDEIDADERTEVPA